MTITEFLLARIGEREALARAATPGPWGCAAFEDEVVATSLPGRWPDEPRYVAQTSYDGLSDTTLNSEADAAHIAANDPAYVLAECEAKRRIIAEHTEKWSGECTTCFDPDTTAGEYLFKDWPCPTLRALALPYADHPDYNTAWAPDLEAARG